MFSRTNLRLLIWQLVEQLADVVDVERLHRTYIIENVRANLICFLAVNDLLRFPFFGVFSGFVSFYFVGFPALRCRFDGSAFLTVFFVYVVDRNVWICIRCLRFEFEFSRPKSMRIETAGMKSLGRELLIVLVAFDIRAIFARMITFFINAVSVGRIGACTIRMHYALIKGLLLFLRMSGTCCPEHEQRNKQRNGETGTHDSAFSHRLATV